MSSEDMIEASETETDPGVDAPMDVTHGVAIDWQEPGSGPIPENALRVIMGLRHDGTIKTSRAIDIKSLAEMSGEDEKALRSSNMRLLKKQYKGM